MNESPKNKGGKTKKMDLSFISPKKSNPENSPKKDKEKRKEELIGIYIGINFKNLYRKRYSRIGCRKRTK